MGEVLLELGIGRCFGSVDQSWVFTAPMTYKPTFPSDQPQGWLRDIIIFAPGLCNFPQSGPRCKPGMSTYSPLPYCCLVRLATERGGASEPVPSVVNGTHGDWDLIPG